MPGSDVNSNLSSPGKTKMPTGGIHPDIQKILVLRFSSLGDIVMATAMVRCLRKAYPYAQIDMVVREDFLDLIKANPHLDQKIGLPRGKGYQGVRALKNQLNQERYDLIYDAHRSLRTHYLMPGLEADYKAFYQKHYVKRDLTLLAKVNLIKDMPRMLNRYLEPLEMYGVAWDELGPEVFVPKGALETALSKVTLPSRGTGYIGMIPSAQWPGKRWSSKRFGELARQLIQDSHQSIIVFGGPGDDFCHSICEGLPSDRVVNTQGALSIAEAMAVLKKCDYVVANDTGLMHVSDALNVPTVLILGPTTRELGCLPFHPKSIVLEHNLWCRPCSKNGQAPCIRSKRFCLENTTVESVFKACEQVSQAQGLAW